MLRRSCFKTSDLTETDSRLCNPNRGFYQIFRMRLGEEVDFVTFEQCLVKEESLVLLMILLSDCRTQPISEEALLGVGRVISFFASHGKRLIVRATYDVEGKASTVEPDDFELVKTHFRQVLATIANYWKDIFVYQGLLVGNWGEMHGSKHMTRQHLTELCAIADDYLPEEIYLAVRKPAQYRMLRTHFSEKQVSGECRIGLFDDAILASESDLGTYGDSDGARYDSAWSRSKELEFINKLCTNVPLGGETVLGEGYVKAMQTQAIIDCLATMRVTYLNRLYDTQMLDYFKGIPMRKGAFKGKTLYDYIEAHLGYRYVIKDASVSLEREDATGASEQLVFRLNILNDGFAGAYDSIELALVIVGDSGEKYITLGNLQELSGGEQKCYKATLGSYDKQSKDKQKLYAVAARKQDGQMLSFANTMTDRGVFLGTLSNYQF